MILTEGVFVTQLSGCAGFLVRRIVLVAIKCFVFEGYYVCVMYRTLKSNITMNIGLLGATSSLCSIN